MELITKSRNQREGRYAGRNRYYNISTGRMGRTRDRRVGFSGWFISLRDWSRK